MTKPKLLRAIIEVREEPHGPVLVLRHLNTIKRSARLWHRRFVRNDQTLIHDPVIHGTLDIPIVIPHTTSAKWLTEDDTLFSTLARANQLSLIDEVTPVTVGQDVCV